MNSHTVVIRFSRAAAGFSFPWLDPASSEAKGFTCFTVTATATADDVPTVACKVPE